MEQVGALLQRHVTAAFVVSLVLFIAGVCLLFRPRSPSKTWVAKRRGVVVDGDNKGTIITGNVGGEKSDASSGGWLDVTGVIVAILAVVVAALAWWFPKPPT